jgi:hypothetical protein
MAKLSPILPTIVNFNAIGVRIYNATSSFVRFKTKIFSYVLKNALSYYNAVVVVVNFKIEGRIGSWSHWKFTVASILLGITIIISPLYTKTPT